MEDNYESIKETMKKIEPFGAKTKPTINGYCTRGEIPAIQFDGRWYIRKDYTKCALERRNELLSVDEILFDDPGYQRLTEKDRKQCYRKVSEQTGGLLIEDDQYSILFAGRLIEREDEGKLKEIIEEVVTQYEDRARMIPKAEAASRMGLSPYQLKELIDAGKVKAKRVKNDWYVEEEEVRKYDIKKSGLIGVYDLVKDLASKANTLFDVDDQANRYGLNAMISTSKLSGLLVSSETAGLKGDKKNVYYIPIECREQFEKLLLPYLKQYGLAEKRLMMLEGHAYWKEHPKTWNAVKEFSDKKVPHGMAALMEIIVENLKCEIMDATDNMIDKMADYAQESLTEIYQQYFAKFLKYIKDNYKCRATMTVNYRTGKAHKRKIDYSPYSVEEYMLFAYMNFDDDFIKSKEFVKKALDDFRFAFLWLRSCWHYVAMWRDIDILEQIPVVPMKYTRKELRERIIKGTFTEEEADALSVSLEYLIDDKKLRPRKTGKEALRVHFPESLRPVIGLAYACCLTHQNGEFLEGVKPKDSWYRDFYEGDYTKIFGKKAFMNRRANKSYADSIVEITEKRKDKEHKVRGYMVATFARGHVKEYGKVSGMTQKYLSCKMDGLSDNEIIMLLMEMGTCSFTVNMLLEAVYGKAYEELPIKQQAELVKEMGITPRTVEYASSAVLKAYRRSKKLAKELIASYPAVEDQKKACRDAMVNIIEGNAAAKNKGISCLSLAFLRPCTEPKCKDCLGCENAILHKGALSSAFKTLKSAYRKMHAARTEATRNMYRALIDEKYLPAIYELLITCKRQYRLDVSNYSTKLKELIMEKGGH